jgi:hypothetical protein
MADDFGINVDVSEIQAAFAKLADKLQNKVLKKALQIAGDTILNPMIELAPEHTSDPTPNGTSLQPGFLKADLHTEVKVTQGGGSVKIGPSQVAGHVARWQNNGWVLTSHGGKKIREIPGKHFIEAAFDEAADAALAAFCEELAKGIAENQGD